MPDTDGVQAGGLAGDLSRSLNDSHAQACRRMLDFFTVFILAAFLRSFVEELLPLVYCPDTFCQLLTFLFVLLWTYYAWSYLAYLVYPFLLSINDPLTGRIHTPISDLFYLLLLYGASRWMILDPRNAVWGVLFIFTMHRYKAYEIWSRILGEAERHTPSPYANHPGAHPIAYPRNPFARFIRSGWFFLFPPTATNARKEYVRAVSEAFGKRDPRTALFSVSTDWSKNQLRYLLFILATVVAGLAISGLIGLWSETLKWVSLGQWLNANLLSATNGQPLTPLHVISLVAQAVAIGFLVYYSTTANPRRRPLFLDIVKACRIAGGKDDQGKTP